MTNLTLPKLIALLATLNMTAPSPTHQHQAAQVPAAPPTQIAAIRVVGNGGGYAETLVQHTLMQIENIARFAERWASAIPLDSEELKALRSLNSIKIFTGAATTKIAFDPEARSLVDLGAPSQGAFVFPARLLYRDQIEPRSQLEIGALTARAWISRALAHSPQLRTAIQNSGFEFSRGSDSTKGLDDLLDSLIAKIFLNLNFASTRDTITIGTAESLVETTRTFNPQNQTVGASMILDYALPNGEHKHLDLTPHLTSDPARTSSHLANICTQPNQLSLLDLTEIQTEQNPKQASVRGKASWICYQGGGENHPPQLIQGQFLISGFERALEMNQPLQVTISNVIQLNDGCGHLLKASQVQSPKEGPPGESR